MRRNKKKSVNSTVMAAYTLRQVLVYFSERPSHFQHFCKFKMPVTVDALHLIHV